ncbi:uncharacterized protein G2W53_006285 [Senna tora]|uniref:Uncharacterized protein n=1 Tax=Senna tora TaxID=362788 RepID=A0A834X3D6_9FABA|nr:uncharacterized protein G2W53_006285 [Senna tora]
MIRGGSIDEVHGVLQRVREGRIGWCENKRVKRTFWLHTRKHKDKLSGVEEEEEEVGDVGAFIAAKEQASLRILSSSSMNICLHLHSTLQNPLSPLQEPLGAEKALVKKSGGFVEKHDGGFVDDLRSVVVRNATFGDFQYHTQTHHISFYLRGNNFEGRELRDTHK